MKNQLSNKLGSYENGLNAFFSVFANKFLQPGWKIDGSNNRAFCYNDKGELIFLLDWKLDAGGLFLMVASEYLNDNIQPFYLYDNKVLRAVTFCNRPLHPRRAKNYVSAARFRRNKPKYKREACKLAREIFCNYHTRNNATQE